MAAAAKYPCYAAATEQHFGTLGSIADLQVPIFIAEHSDPAVRRMEIRSIRCGIVANHWRAYESRSPLFLEFGIPIKEIHPALVKVIRRELPAFVQEYFRTWLDGSLFQGQGAFAEQPRSFGQIAPGACRDDIFPRGSPAQRARNHMVESQFAGAAAVLASEFIAQEQIEPRKRGCFARLDVLPQHHDRRQPERSGRRTHHFLVFGEHVHPIQISRLDGLLPIPKRKWKVGKWPKVSVQNER